MNPTVYAPQGQSINQSITQALLAKNMVEKFVIERFPQYHVVNKLVAQLGQGSKEVAGRRKVEIPRLGNTYPAASIATRAVSGGVLSLTWQDPTATPFRVEDVVVSETGVGAICIEVSAGIAKFVFQYSPDDTQTGFAAADFAALEEVSSRGSMPAVSAGKVGTSRRVTEPSLDYNYIPLFQETGSYNYEEASEKTYLQDGYWIESVVYQALQNISETFSVQIYDSVRSNRNDRYTHDGFEQQINRGSGVVKNFSGELNETYLQTMIDDLKANGGGGNEFAVIGGYNYIGEFQRNVGRGYITYAGTTNTLGGQTVEGINIKEYAYNGTTIKFIEDPMFANPNMFINASASKPSASKQSRKAFWFNTAPVTLANGKGTAPFLKSYQYGPMDMMIADFPGYMGKDGNINVGAAKQRSLEFNTDILYNKYHQLMNPSACGVHIGN